MSNLPRSEYPRPQFVRESWMNLNGEWDFSFDTDSFDRKITVPYAYQCKLSGIDIQDFHDHVWYRKCFTLPADMQGKKILLHFGAVDYFCRVWVNGTLVTEHTGGHISFEADITHALKEGENEIRLFVEDKADDLEMPRGKQFWEKTSKSIFYTRTTGIWQTVWLEAVADSYLSRVFITPDIDDLSVEFRYEIEAPEGCVLEADISFEGTHLRTDTVDIQRGHGAFTAHIDQQQLSVWAFYEQLIWTPENPRLFDVTFRLKKDGSCVDCVTSYFGMRKVSIEGGHFMLNNRTYYQKLLLDQGYWEDSLLTAPTDEDYVKDITLAKEMGFNGVRKHQKIEDPRFLYHADKLGFLVWGEIAASYVYSRRSVKRITDEWMDEIFRDYNHPSIVAWTPLNESWGVANIRIDKQMQSHSAAMVYLTKSLDQTRPVISNDGWEHTCTDLLTIHDYDYCKETMKQRYATVESAISSMHCQRPLIAEGWKYEGQPILVTEFGGISYRKSSQEGWGYSNATSDEDFARRYYDVVSALLESPVVEGFCYTQISDVEQEINGLLTYDRVPKIDPAIIRAINEGTWKPGAGA